MAKYNLRVKPTSRPKATLIKNQAKERENQLKEAVQYCVEKNCRGYSAVKSGLFPLIKDRRTIDKRLDGKSGTGDEKEYCSVVTISEEKAKNKNRCLQQINGKEVT